MKLFISSLGWKQSAIGCLGVLVAFSVMELCPKISEGIPPYTLVIPAIILASYLGCRSVSRNTSIDTLEGQLEAYNRVCENVPHLIWLADIKLNCDFINSAWVTYTGIKKEEMRGRHYFTNGVCHPDDVKVLVPLWDKAVKSNQAFTYEVRLRRHDGQYRWHHGRAKPFVDDKGIKHWIGTCTEWHEEKLAIDQIAAADLRKDEFLAFLSHELRNPLAPITNAVAVLTSRNRQTPFEPAVNNMLSIIDRQVRHLQRLVEDLMDVSRISRGKIRLQTEPLDLGSVIMQSIESVRPQIDNKQQHLKPAIPSETIWVNGDRTRLTQVFGNLLTNASKYTESEGSIWVAAEIVNEDGNKFVCVHIEDTGVGIPKEFQPRIFDLFMQEDRSLDRSQGGLGIGLNLVRSLVELHQGTVTVRSEGKGQGSTFTVKIPLARETVTRPVVLVDSPPVAKDRLKIVVVDDNRDATESLKLFLEGEGHEVHPAFDGEEAIGVICETHPDAVFLDIGLPRMSGYDVCKVLKSDQPYPGAKNLLVIAITGYGMPADKELAIQCGFDAHLSKPADFNHLLAILAKHRLTAKKPTIRSECTTCLVARYCNGRDGSERQERPVVAVPVVL